ncbi:hypothetical protein SUDANB95_02820 [Actinosynnema sp. ALI-1.44]
MRIGKFAAVVAALVLGLGGVGAAQAGEVGVAADGPFLLRPVHTAGKCMDVTGGPGAVGNGARVQLWTCLGPAQTNQHWYLLPAEDGRSHYVIARHSSKCLDVTGVSYSNGALLQQFTCLGVDQTNQLWQVRPFGDGTYQLVAKHSGKCADAKDLGIRDGTPVQQWTCLGRNQTNQVWRLIRI